MKKTVLKLGLSALLATNLLLLQDGLCLQTVHASGSEPAKAEAVAGQKIKGKITNVSQKAKTVAMSLPDNSFFLLKFSDDTTFEHIASSRDMKPGESVVAHYKVVDGENIATKIAAALVELPKGAAKIEVDALEELMAKNKNLVVIDSRPAVKYDEFHIPGAISIPLSSLAGLGDKGAELLEPYKGHPLVFYCGGTTCTMSPKSAALAVKWGHKDVHVFVDGMPKWKKSGRRVAPSLDYVETGNIVLIDLRDTDAVEAGHLPRAFTIPADEFEDADEMLPKSLGAPIYIYSDDPAQVKAAAKEAKEWGYKNIIPFIGALEDWKAAGKDLVKGPAKLVSEDMPIVWERRLGPGEISISDFTKSLDSDLIQVIDARTPGEYSTGHFPGSVNIPLEQMKARMAEIPKDKFIVVHCKTGGRGEIGYRMLKEEGYSVKFLNAECECSTSGEFEIW